MHGPLSTEEIRTLGKLPLIARAREHHLYGSDGSRWVDCWADGGRVLEGHRPGGLSKRVKNELDRGLYSPYPSIWQTRLEKALLKAFPGYSDVRLYRNPEEALSQAGLPQPPVDPLDNPSSADRVLWGRFLLPDHPGADYLLPVMPLSGLGEVQPVLFRNNAARDSVSQMISPIILAALTRAVLPLSGGKLPIDTESSDIWERRGPYMLFRGEKSEYQKIFDALFRHQVLIAPTSLRPSLFPLQPSERERRLILSGGCLS